MAERVDGCKIVVMTAHEFVVMVKALQHVVASSARETLVWDAARMLEDVQKGDAPGGL